MRKKYLSIKKVTVFYLASTVIFLLANSKPLFAQEIRTDTTEIFELSLEDLLNIEVVTASKKVQNISDAPAMVYVISKEDIKNRGYSTLKDVLHDLPGIGVHENYFSETGTLIAARGISGNNKIITLVNGIRINPAGNEHLPIRSDISVRAAQQIEIIYGPGSTLYGADAISMVINIITETPGEKGTFNVVANGGTNNHKEGFLSFGKNFNGGENNGVDISGYVSWIDTDLDNYKNTFPDWYQNYIDQDGGATPSIANGPVRYDKGFNGFMKLASKNTSITFWHRESSRNSGEGGFTPVLQMVDEAVWHDRTTVIEAKNNLELSDKIELESSLSTSKYEIDPESRYVFNGNGTGSPLFLNDWKFGTGVRANLEEKISIEVNENLSFLAGGVISYRQILPKATVNRSDEDGLNADNNGLDPALDILSQGQSFVYYPDSTDPTNVVEISNYTLFNYKIYSGYMEGQYKINDMLKAVAGFRIDHDTRYEDFPISPRGAIIFSPNKNLNIKGIYTRAFVNPAPYFSFAAFNGVNINAPNPDLEPEIAQSMELNTTYTTSNYMIGLSSYYNLQDNILVQADDGQSYQLLFDQNLNPAYLDANFTQPVGVSQSVNGGKSTVIGADLYGKWNIKTTSLWGSFSILDFEGETKIGDKIELDAIANTQARFGVTKKWLENKLVTTASVEWRSSLTRVDGNTAGLDKEVENPYVANAFVSYTPIQGFDVFVKATNITNNEYALKGILGPTPQELLKVTLGLRYTF